MPGTGKLILTGQLGEVMKESAQAALTLAKKLLDDPLERDRPARARACRRDAQGRTERRAWRCTSRSCRCSPTAPVRNDVAMTGEISLRGMVLPIGGVKEKVLAALRAGIRTVMLPRRNQKDLEDVPAAGARAARVRLARSRRGRGGLRGRTTQHAAAGEEGGLRLCSRRVPALRRKITLPCLAACAQYSSRCSALRWPAARPIRSPAAASSFSCPRNTRSAARLRPTAR